MAASLALAPSRSFHRLDAPSFACNGTLSSRISFRMRKFRCISQTSSEDNQLDLNLPRRRMIAEFTCKACSARTKRMINPVAYKRGTVFVQCGGCEVYHKLVDNLGLIVEYRFKEEDESDDVPNET